MMGKVVSCVVNPEKDLMPSSKHGTELGGCFDIQHQKEETMAAVLLAWEGDHIVTLKALSSLLVIRTRL